MRGITIDTEVFDKCMNSAVDRYQVEKALKELILAIDSKWKKTTPPKELIEPLRKARALLE